MIQRGQLCAGGMVAAGAGFVSVPALFRTGGGLRFMLHQSMVQRGQLRVGGMVAAGAGFVGVPALFRAGRGFCFMQYRIMTELLDPVSLRIGSTGCA